jgi:predicted nucleotidyltransferase
MDELVFLSARVPRETRKRFKSLAARNGLTVQELLRKLIDEYLRHEDEQRPALAQVVAELRRRRDLFRSRGIRRLAVFGSVARGEATPQSDVDIAVEYEPGREPSLSGFAGLREDLRDLLGRDVDLADWKTLRSNVRAAVDREAIDVL